tara:strand:- start:609 stop:1004 length:396 start_codon:yes stop_codon:yes gene_type:complete
MATKKITFDPAAGVPVASNLTIYGGSDFKAVFSIVNVSDAAYPLYSDSADWTASSQVQKGAGVAATTTPAGTFVAGIDTSAGKITLSMGSTDTASLAQGRYLYNVLVGTGASVYNMINGNILVYTGISSAP